MNTDQSSLFMCVCIGGGKGGKSLGERNYPTNDFYWSIEREAP